MADFDLEKWLKEIRCYVDPGPDAPTAEVCLELNALDEIARLARLGAAVEAMRPLESLLNRGIDNSWSAESEVMEITCTADSPMEALTGLRSQVPYEPAPQLPEVV